MANRNTPELCTVEDCDLPYRCTGYCQLHYARFRKWGTPAGAPVKFKPQHLCLDCPKPINKISTRCTTCSGRHRIAMARKTRRLTPQGYVVLSGYRDHPNSQSRGGHIYEHTLVMSNMLGRALLPGENVHHINGVRDDNRPENLELWSTAQPPGQRVADKVSWAKDLLARYEPEALAG